MMVWNEHITLVICKEQITNVIAEIKNKTNKQESSFRSTQKGETHGGSHLIQLLAVSFRSLNYLCLSTSIKEHLHSAIHFTCLNMSRSRVNHWTEVPLSLTIEGAQATTLNSMATFLAAEVSWDIACWLLSNTKHTADKIVLYTGTEWGCSTSSCVSQGVIHQLRNG